MVDPEPALLIAYDLHPEALAHKGSFQSDATLRVTCSYGTFGPANNSLTQFTSSHRLSVDGTQVAKL